MFLDYWTNSNFTFLVVFVSWSFAIHCIELSYVISNLYKAVQSYLSRTVVISFLFHEWCRSKFITLLPFLIIELSWTFYYTSISVLWSCPGLSTVLLYFSFSEAVQMEDEGGEVAWHLCGVRGSGQWLALQRPRLWGLQRLLQVNGPVKKNCAEIHLC